MIRALAALQKNLVEATPSVLPGLALAAAVALGGFVAAAVIGPYAPIPAMLLALCLGIALNPAVGVLSAEPGLSFCMRSVLRFAVALMGLRVGLSDIYDIGLGNALVVVAGMAVAIVSGFVFARWSGHPAGFGALAGVATGVCGASAALATSSVVPDYKGKREDLAFVIVAVNAFATVAMLLYPSLCSVLGFDAQQTGVLLGGTIHDVAQVAGAGYAISPDAGNAAVIVKLFRVFLLLPVILIVQAYFSHLGMKAGDARVQMPLFALAFVALCIVNSLVPLNPALIAVYAPVKSALLHVSTWGLLLAVAALGLCTSVRGIVGLGWRPLGLVAGTSVVILAVVTLGLLALAM